MGNRARVRMVLLLASSAVGLSIATALGAGSALWTRQFGSNAGDYPAAVAVDASGNAYVVGTTHGTLPGQSAEGGGDAFVRRYSASGKRLWTRQFGTSSDDFGTAVATDPAGNVYVVGFTQGTLPGQSAAGGADAFVRKYSSGGQERWTRQFGSDEWDRGYGVAVDSSGNVYVVGYTQGTLPGQSALGGADAFVRRYSSGGQKRWTRQFGTAEDDSAHAVAVDASGNVYVAGQTYGALTAQPNAGDKDAFVRKYSSGGQDRWTRQFGTAVTEYATGVAVDGSGSVYLAGYTNGELPGQSSVGGYDAYLRKYSSSGQKRWTRQFGTTEFDFVAGVATRGSNHVYVAGGTEGTLSTGLSATDRDAFVREYASSGQKRWTRQFGTADTDEGNGLAVDRKGDVRVAGYTDGALVAGSDKDAADAFVRKYEGS